MDRDGATLACVARDSNGVLLHWRCKHVDTTSPLLVESLAADLAVEITSYFCWPAVLLEGDSMSVMEAINSMNSNSD